MANVLTGLAPDIYKAADMVGREITGFISSSTINSNTDGIAVGQGVRAAFTRSVSATDTTPSMTIPEGVDQTIDYKEMTLTKQRGVAIPYTGEDIKYLSASGEFATIYGDQIKQAMRTLANEVETDLATAAYQGASRAVGTAGTTPFGSNFDLIAEARQIILDNGMPVSDGRSSLILNTSAGTLLRNMAQLQKVNESGSSEMLRRGTLLDLQGVMLKESAQVQSHTKGTGTGYLINDAGTVAVGETSIPLDTGSGTIVAGDIITINSDTSKYVVNTALAGGSLAIGGNGLRSIAANNAAVTVGNNYTANVMMHQSALELAMRAPAKPFGGDAAVDVMTVQDPSSGLVFEISVYKGFGKAMIYVSAVWGVKAWKPDAIALVLG